MTHYGKDCPKGMVQVEFVGVDPKARHSEYGYVPTETAFIELYVDGKRYRIDAGDIGQYCHDGKPRRGIHINGPFGNIGDLSVNALVWATDDSEPLRGDVHAELKRLRERVAELEARSIEDARGEDE